VNDPDNNLRFQQLDINNWRQFSSISIDFHPRLTVLTGANASGKTTLLNLLGRHFDWVTQYIGRPTMSANGLAWDIDDWSSDLPGQHEIGHLTYSNQLMAPLSVHGGGATYDVALNGQQFVPGLFLPSHRSMSAYKVLATLPAQFSATDQIFRSYLTEVTNRWMGNFTQKTPMTQMKESLMAAAMFGYDTGAIEGNPEARAVWEGFQEVLSHLLPASLGFTGLITRPPEIVMQTHSGEFLIDAASGGISSLIEISWQIFLRSRQYPAFTVCMDEPENHLHPQLQRSVIPALLDAFPHITFIVATHSPFIVTSVNESNVYVLDYEDGTVVSRLLDSVSKSASSDEVLRRVLGLETTTPLWVEQRIAQVLSQFTPGELTATDLRRLRDTLRQMGLNQEFPAAIEALNPLDNPGEE
jgi:hypothetical protein